MKVVKAVVNINLTKRSTHNLNAEVDRHKMNHLLKKNYQVTVFNWQTPILFLIKLITSMLISFTDGEKDKTILLNQSWVLY